MNIPKQIVLKKDNTKNVMKVNSGDNPIIISDKKVLDNLSFMKILPVLGLKVISTLVTL